MMRIRQDWPVVRVLDVPTFEGFIEKHGRAVARLVAEYFGGHRIYIPKSDRLARLERNAFMRALYRQIPSFTYMDLQTLVLQSRGERISIRQIRRIVHKKCRLCPSMASPQEVKLPALTL